MKSKTRHIVVALRMAGIAGQDKGFRVSLTEPLGMDSAQVTAGGVMTEEFCPETLQSHLVPGLYACGECAWTGIHGGNRPP